MTAFALNLGFFFDDAPLLKRFGLAREAGFSAVEFWWPTHGESFEAIGQASSAAGLDVVLFNMDEGDYAKGERGYAAAPDRVTRWREQLDAALELAEIVQCPRINTLTGDWLSPDRHGEQLDCLIENLAWAAPRAAARGIDLLLEPLNAVTHPTYICQTTTDALEIMDRVGAPNLLLQYDVFQIQRGEGDVVHRMRTLMDRIGHIQIGDSPDRGAPGTGELNYDFILDQIDAAGYRGHVGLEYKTGGDPVQALAWLPRALRGAAPAVA